MTSSGRSTSRKCYFSAAPNRQGHLIGGVCLNGDLQMEGNIEEIGAKLLGAVRAWGNAGAEHNTGIITKDVTPDLSNS